MIHNRHGGGSGEVTSGVPFKPEQVCGLQRDGTDKYWLLE